MTSDEIGGRYKVLATLGRGAQAVVYRARDMTLGRDVAIKLFDGDRERGAGRLEVEAHVIARLAHPNTVRLLDFGKREDGTPYLVMELLHGSTLRTQLARFDVARMLDVVRQVASALDEAHSLGVVHRDIKPENIFLEKIAGHDLVRVVDFGIARVTAIHSEALTELNQPQLTAKGILVGTPAYLAPELALGHAPRPSSDVYALGAVAYECLAKQPPFTGSIQKVLVAQVKAEPPKLEGLPPPIEALIASMLAKAPEARPTAAAIISAIDAARVVDRGSRELPRRPGWLPIAAATALLMVLLLGLVSILQLTPSEVEATSIASPAEIATARVPPPPPAPVAPKRARPASRRGLIGHRVLEGGYSSAEAKKTIGFMEGLLLRCQRTTQVGADARRKLSVRFVRIGDATALSIQPDDAGGRAYLACIEPEAKLFVWPPYRGHRAVVEVDVVP